MSDSDFFDQLLAIYRNRAEASILALLTYKTEFTKENVKEFQRARDEEFAAMKNLKTFAMKGRQ